MFRAFRLSATTLGFIALAIGIASFVMPNWIEVDYNVTKLLEASKGVLSSEQDVKVDALEQMIGHASDESVKVGLFRVTASIAGVGSGGVSLIRSSAWATILPIVIGWIFIIGGLCATGRCSEMSLDAQKQRKNKARARTGLICFTLGALLLVGGASMFIVKNQEVIHNGPQFTHVLDQAFGALGRSYLNGDIDLNDGYNDNYYNGDRKRRDAMQDGGAELMKLVKNEIDPVYGTSFYMSWVSAALTCIAAFFAMFALIAVCRENAEIPHAPMKDYEYAQNVPMNETPPPYPACQPIPQKVPV